MPATATKPLEVKLQVCHHCNRVGKYVDGQYKGFCVGPMGEKHKKAKTQERLFKEVVA